MARRSFWTSTLRQCWVSSATRRRKPTGAIQIQGLPKSWIDTLSACGSVNLLTCPRTNEQYVGSATGQQGFWQRWMDYVRNRHGGNLGLKSKNPSVYQVSILEVAGTAATADEVRRSEGRWQAKLQSQEMGLNRNCAGR